MTKFVKITASKLSLAKRKLLYGIGINDAWYTVRPTIDGKGYRCPVHRKWADMLTRCYDTKLQGGHSTYKGCAVCDEWLTFSKFAKWFESNSVSGHELDKDLKVKNNKVYSPDACLFVPHCINSLLTDSAASRGDCPIGVCLNKANGKYKATVAIDGKNKNLGHFTTPELAHEAYKISKNKEITRKSEQYPEFAEYLINHLIT